MRNMKTCSEIRHANLLALIDKAGSIQAVAEKLGKDHAQISQLKTQAKHSKTGKPRYVPLSTAAVAIIEALPHFKGCPWLVPNPETRKPFVSIKHGWRSAIKEANLPDRDLWAA